MLKQFFNRLKPNKKIIKCTRCTTRLSIPIKPAKTLRITCPKCHTQFEVTFTNPFKEIWQWDKAKNLSLNVKQISTNYSNLPRSTKQSLLFLMASLLITLVLFTIGIKKMIVARNDLNSSVKHSISLPKKD